MKHFLTTLGLFILSTYSITSQNEPFNYITKQPIVVYSYDLLNGESVPSIVKIANPNLIFNQIGEIKNDEHLGSVYVIQILPIKVLTDQLKGSATKINSDNNDQFFCIKSEDYKEPAIKKRYKTWIYNSKPNIGTLVVPIKMRPKRDSIPFDFTTDFTLGNSFGYSFRMSHYQPNYLSIVGVLGVTSVSIDSATSKGTITQSSAKLSALTGGIGIITEISNFQIGAVFGWDVVGGAPGKSWIYNGQTWFSIGIGYQFLRKNDEK
jgi:hypothetical protein